jgi:hypothetical protein
LYAFLIPKCMQHVQPISSLSRLHITKLIFLHFSLIRYYVMYLMFKYLALHLVLKTLSVRRTKVKSS